MQKSESESAEKPKSAARKARLLRYRSSAFAEGFRELFGANGAQAFGALLASEVIPVGPDIPGDLAVGQEATIALAAVASSLTRPSSIPDAARSILALDYQLEFGPQASGDRKGRREGSPPPEKDYFGSQLAMTFRDLAPTGSAERGRNSPFEVTIGWTALGGIYALIHFTRSQTTFVYTRGYLMPDLHPGIVRLTALEFDLPVKLHLSAEKVAPFARMMRGDEGVVNAAGDSPKERSTDG